MRHAHGMMIGILAVAGSVSAASAGTFAWNVAIQLGDGNAWNAGAPENLQFSSVEQVPGANGGIAFRIVGSRAGTNWSANWDLLLDQDPFVSSNFSITNNTGILQTFTIAITTASVPLTAPTVMSGSISGFVGDGNGLADQFGNGATVRTQGGFPFYEALVDGVGVRSLYTDPTSASAVLFNTSPIAEQNFAGEAGPAIAASIGIRNHFELTPGDNAGFTSTFLIVPSPAGLGLFGAIGLVALRRRR